MMDKTCDHSSVQVHIPHDGSQSNALQPPRQITENELNTNDGTNQMYQEEDQSLEKHPFEDTDDLDSFSKTAMSRSGQFSRCCNKCVSHVLVYTVWLVTIASLAVATAVYYNDDTIHGTPKGIPYWKIFFFFAIMVVVPLLARLLMFIIATLLLHVGGKHSHAFVYYLQSTKSELLQLSTLGFGLLAFILILKPTMLEIPELVNTTDFITRICSVVLVLMSGNFLTKLFCARLTLHFNSRTFKDKLYASIYEEYELACISGLFNNIEMDQIRWYHKNIQHETVDPKFMQTAANHIKSRHVYQLYSQKIRSVHGSVVSANVDSISHFLAIRIYKDLVKKVVGIKVREAIARSESTDTLKSAAPRYIYRTDLSKVFESKTGFSKFISEDTFCKQFVSDGVRVSLYDLKQNINRILFDRLNLRQTLIDSGKVVKSVQVFVKVGVYTILSMPIVAIFGLDATQVWLALSSVLLAFTFVFGNAMKNAFESVVFIFGVHAFDVGDTVKITFQNEISVFRVASTSLLTTEFKKWNGSVVKLENHKLLSYGLVNLSTSGNHSDSHRFDIDADVVTTEFMRSVRSELEAYINLNKKFTSFSFTARETKDKFKITIVLWVEHAYPNINSAITYKDQSEILVEYMKILKRNGARYSGTGLGELPASTKRNIHVHME